MKEITLYLHFERCINIGFSVRTVPAMIAYIEITLMHLDISWLILIYV